MAVLLNILFPIFKWEFEVKALNCSKFLRISTVFKRRMDFCSASPSQRPCARFDPQRIVQLKKASQISRTDWQRSSQSVRSVFWWTARGAKRLRVFPKRQPLPPDLVSTSVGKRWWIECISSTEPFPLGTVFLWAKLTPTFYQTIILLCLNL